MCDYDEQIDKLRSELAETNRRIDEMSRRLTAERFAEGLAEFARQPITVHLDGKTVARAVNAATKHTGRR